MKISTRPIAALTLLAVLALAAGAWAYVNGSFDGGRSPLSRVFPWYGGHGQNHLALLGNVDVRQVSLAFKAGGRIATMRFEEGDAVKAGQVVATLEKQDFEDEVRIASARLRVQAAALAELEAGTRREEIEQARAVLAERRAILENARLTLERRAALAKRGYAAHQQHDDAVAAVREAEARVKSAQAALRLAEAGPRREDVEQARAQLGVDKAALSIAERRLADATLIAPNDGVILTRVREPGAIVASGETIYTLTLTSPVWVRTYVGEPDLGRVYAGMPAEVRTDSGGTFRGQIGFISPVAEFTPKTVETRQLRTSLVYRLRVIVADPDKGLRQGMPVTVVLRPNDRG